MESKHEALIPACDAFLDHHRHSRDAYRHVVDVLNKFDELYRINYERALRELYFDSNVIPFPRRPILQPEPGA